MINWISCSHSKLEHRKLPTTWVDFYQAFGTTAIFTSAAFEWAQTAVTSSLSRNLIMLRVTFQQASSLLGCISISFNIWCLLIQLLSHWNNFATKVMLPTLWISFTKDCQFNSKALNWRELQSCQCSRFYRKPPDFTAQFTIVRLQW